MPDRERKRKRTLMMKILLRRAIPLESLKYRNKKIKEKNQNKNKKVIV